MKVLIPIDDTSNSLKAVAHAIHRPASGPLEIHLLHVRSPFSQHVARFVGWGARVAYHRQEAEKAVAAARALLQKSRIAHAVHVEIAADRARAIHDAAQRLGASRIVIGTARKNSLARMVTDSVTNRLLGITEVPVEVVVGNSISLLERYAIPAAIGATILYLAIE